MLFGLMSNLATYDIDDLKLIYRVLHKQMLEHIELLDSQLFSELQGFLQAVAQRDGVDVTHHSAWDAWLHESSALLAR